MVLALAVEYLRNSPLDIAHCLSWIPWTTRLALRIATVLQIRNEFNQTLAEHSTFVAGCAAGDDINNPGGHVRRGGAWAARLVSGPKQDVFDGSMLSELSKAASIGATISHQQLARRH